VGELQHRKNMSHTALVKTVPIKDIRALRQMAEDLKQKGINVELVANAVPRMYYRDQIGRHLKAAGKKFHYHTNPEECDYVLKVKDAFYDIGFLRDENGNLVPIFDDFDYPSQTSGYGLGGIKKFLGTGEGKKAGFGNSHVQEDDEGTLHSIGKMLQSYSVNAACNAATDAGYSIVSSGLDANGQVVLEVEVSN